jgi:transposase-like protein
MLGSIKNLFQGPVSSVQDTLTEVLREGAQKMLACAIQAEVDEYVSAAADHLDEHGHRLVVRNGYNKARTVQTGIGAIEVKSPTVNDKRIDAEGQRRRFQSQILPPYLRKTKSLEELIPWLYLKGISTGDFGEALAPLLGENPSGLSAGTVVRLKAKWEEEHAEWEKRSLASKQYVYVWADGVHFNIRLGEKDRACMLVIIGATEDGKKELLAVRSGIRESELSWKELLIDLAQRGLKAPALGIADGALGFWKALSEVFPTTAQQMCWVHKTANVLDKLPKTRQSQAKAMIHEMYNADTRSDAERALVRFQEVFEAKWPKAVASILRNEERMFSFYDFPAEHWQHIRSTNVIESAFATVRLRSKRTKGCGSAVATEMMVFKLMQSAEKNWRRLRGYERLADVLDINIQFENGVRKEAA